MPFRHFPFSRSLSAATLAVVMLSAGGLNVALAESPAPPALPETPEHPAFAFARQDVALAEQAAQAAAERVAAEKALAEAARQKVAGITTARDGLKKTIAEQTARQKQLPALQAAAEKAATAARTELKTAEEAAGKDEADPAKAADELKTLQAKVQQSEQAVAALTKEAATLTKALAEGAARLAEHEAELKTAEEQAKAAAEAAAVEEKQLAEVKKQQTLFTERLAALNELGTTPEPAGIRLLATFTGEYPRWSCRFDPTGRYVFAGAQERLIQRCDLITLQQTPLVGHRSWVRRMTFLPGDGSLVSGDYTGRVIRWKSSSVSEEATTSSGSSGPEAVQTIAAHRGFVRAVAISPDGRWMVTGGNDLIVRIWQAETGTLVAELPGHKRHIYNIAFHPDGRSFVSGDLMGVLKQWSTDSWEHMRDFSGGDMLVGWEGKFQADCGGIRGIHFSPDGRTLAVAGISEVSNPFAGIGKPTVVLFDWETGERKKVLLPKSKITGHAWGVRWHPSGRFLVAACGLSQGTLVFWRPDNAEPFHEFKLPQVAYDVDLHPDGLRIAVAQFDKTLRVYDISAAPPKQETAAATPKK